MRPTRKALVGLLTLAFVPSAWGQDLNFRAIAPSRRPAYVEPIEVTIGRPQAITQTSAVAEPQRVVRAQMGGDFTPPPINFPPPPPYNGGVPGGAPPFGSPAPFPGGPGLPGLGRKGTEEDYNCGRVNSDADTGNFLSRSGGYLERCWYDISQGTGLAGGTGRSMFQSDSCFNGFISPVTNPHLFEDPRALTEVRPIFMWQRTPNSNYVFQGNSNYFADLQARLAITQNISIVINRLGWAWQNPANPTEGITNGNGFSEVSIGPKFTFLRLEDSNTVAALGLNFILPVGSSKVAQDTGDLSLAPYFSIAQGFGRSDYGSFNFMNTTGYSFATDKLRTDFFYASFHLDYDVGNAHTFYPLVEVNWTYYTFDGNARNINFEGSNLTNFGATQVSGHSDLTVALGGRYRLNNNVQFGLAGEMNVLGGGRHLDLFRLTADVIFRY